VGGSSAQSAAGVQPHGWLKGKSWLSHVCLRERLWLPGLDCFLLKQSSAGLAIFLVRLRALGSSPVPSFAELRRASAERETGSSATRCGCSATWLADKANHGMPCLPRGKTMAPRTGLLPAEAVLIWTCNIPGAPSRTWFKSSPLLRRATAGQRRAG
jgi:hypothetical protein